MSELVICRGLPASGKTSLARAWVADDPAARARVNRDDLRAMAHDGVFLGNDTESRIRALRDAAIDSLLSSGTSVVCDDTNLPQWSARDLARIGVRRGATVTVWDLTDVPVDTCVERDAARERPVGEDVIRGMHGRFLAAASYPLPAVLPDRPSEPPRPYAPAEGAIPAAMVDIDGTVALHGGRSPFDESRVGEDSPNANVIRAVVAMHQAGYRMIFCSGRSEDCRGATEAWLDEHVPVPREMLLMRPSGDARNDAVVKREMFDREIRGGYDVAAVFDDRNRVVAAWREIGLTVFQVAPGDF